MGGKQAWGRQQIHLFVAILILLSPVACTLSKTAYTTIMGKKISASKVDEARQHLTLGRKYLAQGHYDNALKEYGKVISLAGETPPADEALFYIAVIYAHPANPTNDHGKSILYSKKLIKDYPKSPLVEQAKAIILILQENDKLSRTVERLNTTSEESKKTVERLSAAIDESKKTVERLNTIIEESKKVDIEIEERRRKKAR